MAYSDTSAGNSGNSYRQDDVDIQPTSDIGGGYGIGWIATGEWLRYSLAGAAGTYDIKLRVASLTGGGRIGVSHNGVALGTVDVPATGSWQSWQTVTLSGVTLPSGGALRLTAEAAGFNLNWLEVIPGEGTGPSSQRIQAEDYDQGGAGVAYSDTSAGNSGGAYRQDDVDIEATSDTGGGYGIGWIATGEWLRYTVQAQAGTYDITLRVASANGGGRIGVSYNGVSLGSVNVPATGSWQSWQTVKLSGVTLPSGGVLRLTAEVAGYNLNWLELTRIGTSPPRGIVDRIEAEDYDQGGAGVAYSDTSTGNSGGAYRQEDVDIEATSDTGGGYGIGWIATGEWLRYTVQAQAGTYDIKLRVASVNGGGRIGVSHNGVSLGSVTVPATGSWQSWQTVTLPGVTLPSGGALRLTAEVAGYNLNWLELNPTAPINNG